MEHLQIRISAETRDAQRHLQSLGDAIEHTGAALANAAAQAQSTQQAFSAVGSAASGQSTTGGSSDWETELVRRRDMEQQANEQRQLVDAEYLAWRQQAWSDQHQREADMNANTTQNMQNDYSRAVDTIVKKQNEWTNANEKVASSSRDMAHEIITAISQALVSAAVQAAKTAFSIESSMLKPALFTSLATSGANALGAIAGIKAASSALVAAETGYDNVVSRPTLFLAGEGFQPEHVSVTPLRGANLHGPSGEKGLAARLDRLIAQVKALQVEIVRSQPVVQVVNTSSDTRSQVKRLDWTRNRMRQGGYDGRGEDLAL